MKKLNFLKSFMLVIAAFACVALAGTAKVAAADDPVDAVAPTDITVEYNATLDVLKLNNSGTEAVKCLVYVCKNTDAKVYDASKATKVTVPASGSANVTLTKVGSTKAMADIKINKTGYVFVGTAVTGKVNVTPNFVINPTACKKLDVTINYNSINATDNTASAIASAKYVDLNGESQAVTDVNNDLEYSTDGKAWSAASGFTGEKLATLVTGAATGKKTVYFRLKGTTGATTVATRPSAAKKYSIAKQAKAPSIKLDIAKSTLNIKNGMEYKIDKGSVDAAGAFTPAAEADTWHVILRTNKDGAATSSEVAGATYKPVKFDRNDDTTKANYTTDKVKSKAFDAATAFGTATDVNAVKISVRTAATEKKPASAAFEMVVLKPAAAPAVATDGIKNNNDNLKISFSGSAALEYVILPSVADVDWSSVKWSKYQAGSFKITARTKTAKYSTTDDTAVDAATVEAGNVLLVRIAGTKQSKTAAPVLPSAYKTINITAVTGDDAPEIGLKLVDPDAPAPTPSPTPTTPPTTPPAGE